MFIQFSSESKKGKKNILYKGLTGTTENIMRMPKRIEEMLKRMVFA
jgi:hypothetical protein